MTSAVRRWKRYGYDRLYVTADDGTKVGWWDLATDRAHPKAAEMLPALVAAVEVWRADEKVVPLAAVESAPVVDGPLHAKSLSAGAVDDILRPFENHQSVAQFESAAPQHVERDLAANLPGAMAREQAVAAKAAAPVKTRLARIFGVHTNERAWRIGADGEEKVAAQFEKLLKKDPRWRFLHAIPVGDRGSDIDHLAIGPGGVFTFNAKHHPGAKIWNRGDTFLVNGQKVPYVRNSRHEAQRAARLLTGACGFEVHVKGIIVPVRAESVVTKLPRPEGVGVVARFQVAKWLRQQPDILDEATATAIYEAARRPEIWRRPTI